MCSRSWPTGDGMLLFRNKLELDRRRAARESPVIKSEGAALSRRCAAIERRRRAQRGTSWRPRSPCTSGTISFRRPGLDAVGRAGEAPAGVRRRGEARAGVWLSSAHLRFPSICAFQKASCTLEHVLLLREHLKLFARTSGRYAHAAAWRGGLLRRGGVLRRVEERERETTRERERDRANIGFTTQHGVAIFECNLDGLAMICCIRVDRSPRNKIAMYKV